jgi:hypothetical protein
MPHQFPCNSSAAGTRCNGMPAYSTDAKLLAITPKENW